VAGDAHASHRAGRASQCTSDSNPIPEENKTAMYFRYLVPTLLALTCAAQANEPTLSFPHAVVANSEIRNYVCNRQETLSVAYVATVDGDAFAYLTAEGRPHIFINVLAASGAKYVSGPYVWWTKGPTGNLSRADDSDAAPLLADCHVVAAPPATLMRRLGSEPH
jgi:membrane-bound inhibitor of C-type lysozyme